MLVRGRAREERAVLAELQHDGARAERAQRVSHVWRLLERHRRVAATEQDERFAFVRRQDVNGFENRARKRSRRRRIQNDRHPVSLAEGGCRSHGVQRRLELEQQVPAGRTGERRVHI